VIISKLNIYLKLYSIGVLIGICGCIDDSHGILPPLSGQKYVEKTLRQLRREQARNHDVAMVVYAGAYFAVFNVKSRSGQIIRVV
jgi:hypothetical protein